MNRGKAQLSFRGYMKAILLLERKTMRALGQLLLRGGVTVGICAVAALSIACFLSLIATSLQPKKQAIA